MRALIFIKWCVVLALFGLCYALAFPFVMAALWLDRHTTAEFLDDLGYALAAKCRADLRRRGR